MTEIDLMKKIFPDAAAGSGVDTMYADCLKLTKDMVAVPSQNATSGERDIGDFIYQYIKKIPYFKKHPEQVMAVPLKNDPLGRRNILALLIGEKDDCKDTVILHGHTDTVGVEDFGSLKDCAFDCDRLAARLLEIQDQLPMEVREDLLSGDYLFGRGSSDMKSGDAVHMTVLARLCEQPQRLRGNVLVSFNPVEESLHTGFIEAVDVLLKLKEKYRLNYLFAINNDYICGMYPGDETRYVYTGSVGKLLPCFYIRGKETHVGQAFEGVDACRIGAELVRLMNLNCDMCDGYKGEFPAPPTVLQMRDLKPYYSVQTPISAFLYFNYMVHNKSVSEIFDGLKALAQKAANHVLSEMDERYRRYCEMVGIAAAEQKASIHVMEYRDIYHLAQKHYSGDLDGLILQIARISIKDCADKRETALKIVERLFELSQIKEPTIILFFATPHCPHNTLKDEVPEEKALADDIAALIARFGAENGENYKLMHFFPSLTDSSYLKIDDDDASIQALKENFPVQELLYPVPYEKIRDLNIPGLNYGAFGKDAHKWTERVKMSYSFGKLPKLIIETIKTYLM